MSTTTTNPPLTHFNPVEMIERRRHALREDTDEELHEWIEQYVQRKIPDYQMSAWLMAVCFHPLTARETATLTKCYAQSGVQVTWPDQRPRLVDKHSSGGVGDKVSLILAPLVASCDICGTVQVPMMAGRGLGHTGGTIDKLESLPGYNPSLSVKEFQTTVHEVGCAIVCATADTCPADQRLYALRDVTSTVQSLPLQTASIMSKKIAENPDSIVLDVKYGHGAFQSTCEEAQKLAESMVAVGEMNGLNPTTAFLTDMNHPIGYAVGNWVEVKECIEIMKGKLDHCPQIGHDLITLVVVQAGQMLYQSQTISNTNGSDTTDHDTPKQHHTLDECIQHAYKVLDSGKALEKFREMMLAQHAEPSFLQRAIDTPDDIPLAKFVATWTCDSEGYIYDIPAKNIGDISAMVGAGRTVAGQKVDTQAGIIFFKQVGDIVQAGDVIVKVYTNISQELAEDSLQKIKDIVQFGSEPPKEPKGPIITHRVTKSGTEPFVIPSFLTKSSSHVMVV
jgi:pyrimidine-nucleoside phosphorylase